MTDNRMQHLINKTLIVSAVLAVSLLSTGCVSGPDEKQPDAIEAANSALSNGVSNYDRNKYELALSYFKNALRDFRSIDHQYGIASSCLNLAKTYLSIGNAELAEAYLKQAQRIIQAEHLNELNDYLSIIESSIAIESNQLAQAKEILAPLLEKDSNNAFTLAAVQNRTRIALAENNRDEAENWTSSFEQKIKTSAGSDTHRARLARFKAALSDDSEKQDKHFNAALNIYRAQTNRPGIAATLQEWGDAQIKRKQLSAAQDKLQRALYIRQSLQDRNSCIKILQSLGQLSSDNKIQTWTARLKNKTFSQWDEFIAAFNRFPE